LPKVIIEVKTLKKAKALLELIQSKACLVRCGVINEKACKKMEGCVCYEKIAKIEE